MAACGKIGFIADAGREEGPTMGFQLDLGNVLLWLDRDGREARVNGQLPL